MRFPKRLPCPRNVRSVNGLGLIEQDLGGSWLPPVPPNPILWILLGNTWSTKACILAKYCFGPLDAFIWLVFCYFEFHWLGSACKVVSFVYWLACLDRRESLYLFLYVCAASISLSPRISLVIAIHLGLQKT